MGKNNRARRAAKVKARQQQRRNASTSPRDPGDLFAPPPPSLRELVDQGWVMVVRAAVRSEPVEPILAELAGLPTRDVDLGAERLLVSQIAHLWLGGWQPAELVREVGRQGSAPVRAIVAHAIAADHRPRPAESLDPRWAAQIEALDLPSVRDATGWLVPVTSGLGTRLDALGVVADALAAISRLPKLDPLIPPPGAGASATWPPDNGYAAPAQASDPVIEKVRNLLAKAESTEFEAEAAAFTAKAQELIVRHAIDRAMLAAGAERDPAERPVAVRVFVDAPYADAKSLLLQHIAAESRCRSVFHTGLDMSTVVGFPDDVAAVQVLFASLLVQGHAALQHAARTAKPGTRPRSQSFRSAFYLAFAQRIRDRLAEAARHVTEEATAELGGAFLPVLADRRDQVDDLFDRRFINLQSGRVRGGWDAAGWASGQQAADRAKLHHGDLADAAASPVGAGALGSG